MCPYPGDLVLIVHSHQIGYNPSNSPDVVETEIDTDECVGGGAGASCLSEEDGFFLKFSSGAVELSLAGEAPFRESSPCETSLGEALFPKSTSRHVDVIDKTDNVVCKTFTFIVLWNVLEV